MNFSQLKIKNISFLFFVLLFFNACKKENLCDCFKRTGKIVQEERMITGFSQLLIMDNINAYIVEDSIFNVIVEAGENIVPLIKTEIDGTTLVCTNDNRCNWTRSYDKPMNVYIHMPKIERIESNGTGNIKSLNTITTPFFYIQTKNSGDVEITLNSKELRTAMHGSSDLTLHGTVNNHECDIGGTGYLRAVDLISGYTFVHTYTIGLCYVYAKDILICNIDQKGDVFCYGAPKQVITKFTNSGRLYFQ